MEAKVNGNNQKPPREIKLKYGISRVDVVERSIYANTVYAFLPDGRKCVLTIEASGACYIRKWPMESVFITHTNDIREQLIKRAE